MKSSILIEIEHTKYIRLIDLETQTSNETLLTTVKKGQKRAIIKLIGKREEKPPIILSEYEIAIPYTYQTGGTRPKIHVKASLWEKTLEVAGYLDGKEVFSDSVRIGRFLPGPNWKPAAAAAGAVAAAALLFILVVPRFLFPERPPGEQQSRTSATNEDEQTRSSDRNAAAGDEEQEQARRTSGSITFSTGLEDTRPEEEGEDQRIQETGTGEREETAIEPPPPPQTVTEEPEAPAAAVPESDISKTVYFDPNSSTLSDEAQAALSDIAEIIREYGDAEVQIYGHCAVRGTEEGREQLSRERARNVEQFFLSRISRDASPGEFDVRWFAGERPVTMETEEQHLNRRVEITILAED